VIRKPLLIAKTGDTVDAIRQVFGDYDRWFAAHVNYLDVHVVEVHKPPNQLPLAQDLAGIIITGSPHSVTEPEDWTHSFSDWMVGAIDDGVPCLGVCYGHQIIGHAFGGEVIRNPIKYEIGTIDVELTEEGQQDPLLGQLQPGARTLAFNAVHADIVSQLPKGAVRLASNTVCVNQAFRFRDYVWAVQFHPEFSTEVMKHYLQHRDSNVRDDARRRDVDPDQAVREASDSIRETPLGPKLINDFVQRYVLGK